MKPVTHAKIRIKLLKALTVGFALTSTLVSAAPTVEGNLLSWPADGWYQVQNARDFSTVCEGGFSCAVAAGTYIVINHSTGQRWTDIDIGDTGTGPSSPEGLTVTGNTISWANDGWYQVQNASDYQTVCEGGNSCQVEHGSYIVINHSTGQRWTDVIVSQSGETGPGGPSAITVNGNTLSWPDDGWYQVQNASNYQTLCEGGSSCLVPAGSYLVINHSNGERFENIVVSGGGETGSGGESAVNDDNAIALITQAFDVFTGRAFDQRVAGSANESSSWTVVSETGAGDATVKTYSCGNGGIVVRSRESLPFGSQGYVSQTNCQVGGDIRDGSLNFQADSSGTSLDFDNYVVTFEPDGRMELNGRYSRTNPSRPSNTITANVVSADWDYFFTYSGGSLRVSNSDVFYQYLLRYNSSIRSIRQGARFDMEPPFAQSSFEVDVLTELRSPAPTPGLDGFYNREEDGTAFNFGTGILRIRSAEDGSELRLNADTGDRYTAEITYISADGIASGPVIYPWTTWESSLCEYECM